MRRVVSHLFPKIEDETTAFSSYLPDGIPRLPGDIGWAWSRERASTVRVPPLLASTEKYFGF
jgi:hypothetical protein